MTTLTIPDKLFILSINDDKNAIGVTLREVLRYGLAGAFLTELAHAQKIRVEGDRLALIDATPTGDPLTDEILAAMAAESKRRRLTRWIAIIARKHTVKQVASRLAGLNVIRIEKKRLLWVIPYEVYPQVDASAKYWIKQQLRSMVLAGEKTDAPDIALLSLLKACRLLRLVFTQEERKYATKKINTLVKGEVFGDAVAKLLAEIQAARA